MFVGKFLADRPTLRGFLVIAAVVLVIMLLNLYTAAAAIGMLLRIAFFLAVAFFLFLMWRDRRDEISTWSRREIVVFYGSAFLILGVIGLYFWHVWPGFEEGGFIPVVACGGIAWVRAARDRHTIAM